MVRVAFVHPDLGIGGAERAVVDAALALKSRGYEVRMYTAHHDVNHCFEETRDGTLNVVSVGDWLPRSLFGILMAFFAYLRTAYIAFYLVFLSGYSYDFVYCDQVSACIPILRLRRSKIIFYCHFPDQLLTERKTCLKKLYRFPIDWIEEWTTGMADVVLVNSLFTASIFKETFKSLSHLNPEILYPVPSFTFGHNDTSDSPLIVEGSRITFLSINRYERKKNLSLAIEALSILQKLRGDLDNVQLVIAGGYDERVVENLEYFNELSDLTANLNLKDHVSFYKSISNALKLELLRSSSCLLYTPDKEHFGIVPIEAMYYGLPVIAVNSGGPKETIVDQVTGFLCDSTADSFAAKMLEFVKDRSLKQVLGQAAHKRVVTEFSFEAFTEKLDSIVSNVLTNNDSSAGKDRHV